MIDIQARFRGVLLGLALGDALGAPFEGGPLERFVWALIGRTRTGDRRWTDDTQMSLDLAESLIANRGLVVDDVASRFAASYRWSRGYGPAAAKVLKRIRGGVPWELASTSVYPKGSFGNGGAMRAPVIGALYASRPEDLRAAAEATARITHAHALGVLGSVLVASATASFLRGEDADELLGTLDRLSAGTGFEARVSCARELIGQREVSPREVRRSLGSGMAATESVVTAVFIAAEFRERPFRDLIDFARRCGGDVDTISAMAGAMWGAANGDEGLPSDALDHLEQRSRLEAAAASLGSLAVEAIGQA